MGHKEQTAGPDDSLNLPAAHESHGPPLGPVKPLLHVQLLAHALPDGDDESARHAKHVLELAAPVAVE